MKMDLLINQNSIDTDTYMYAGSVHVSYLLGPQIFNVLNSLMEVIVYAHFKDEKTKS